jgi:hypothetical protein
MRRAGRLPNCCCLTWERLCECAGHFLSMFHHASAPEDATQLLRKGRCRGQISRIVDVPFSSQIPHLELVQVRCVESKCSLDWHPVIANADKMTVEFSSFLPLHEHMRARLTAVFRMDYQATEQSKDVVTGY